MTPLQQKTLLTYCKEIAVALPLYQYDIAKAEQIAHLAVEKLNPKFKDKGKVWIKRKFLPDLVKHLRTLDAGELIGREAACERGPVVVSRHVPKEPQVILEGKDKMLFISPLEDFVRYNPLLIAERFLGHGRTQAVSNT